MLFLFKRWAIGYSVILLLSVCLPASGARLLYGQDSEAGVGSELKSQVQNDPYKLSFDDFEWSETANMRPVVGSKPVDDSIDLDAAIAIFRSRVSESTSAAESVNLTELGKLLLKRAKTVDDLPAYAESEVALRRAVELNESYRPAKLALAQTLMARHGFKEALKLIQPLAADTQTHAATLAALFDAELELGHYGRAKDTLDRLILTERSAPVMARAARIAELRGEHQLALKHLHAAMEDLRDSGASGGKFAWYHWRIGSLNFDAGELDTAEEHFRRALEFSSGDEASLVGLARTQFAQGNVDQAIVSMRKAAAGEAPPVLALFADMLAHQGDESSALGLWDRTETLMREEAKVAKSAHAREVSLFYADHKRNTKEAVALAKLDLQQREDAFAHDCYAWTLLNDDQIDKADIAIRKALESVPHDNQILFHAAAIADAAGDQHRAKTYAQQIRNPRFSVVHYKQLQRYLQ
ncbi:MAG: hypothetical protein Aurels2KO_37210 [Aureliella sp.]